MLEKKLIFVAGACGRIGRSLCKQLLLNGASVVAGDLDALSLKSLKQELSCKNAGFIEVIELDCTSQASLDEAIAFASSLGKLHGFVNTTYPRGSLGLSQEYLESSYAQICDALNSHLASYILAAQSFAKHFKAQDEGVIINLSSIMGVYAPKFEVYEGTSMISPLEYSVIKAGINHLGCFLAKLLFNTGVRVNTLAAGGIKDAQPVSFLKAYRKNCSSKGMLEADDVSKAAIFLLSDFAAAITGQTLVVDDGWGI